ncbi:MAG: dodecin family protein [Actinomycetota bacterium]|nr:dodecin family protein [Actinomycetota bacterium]
MSDGNIYKKIQLVGSSEQGIDDAIRRAIERASQTMRNLDWFEMKEVRGWIQDGQPKHFQVVLEVGFRLEEGEPVS